MAGSLVDKQFDLPLRFCRKLCDPCFDIDNVSLFQEIVKTHLMSSWTHFVMDYRQLPLCALAAHYGYLNVLKWLCETRKRPLDKVVPLIAVMAGHLDILRWLSKTCNSSVGQRLFEAAAAGDQVSYITGFLELHPNVAPKKLLPMKSILLCAIASNSTRVLDFFSNKHVLSVEHFQFAIEIGNVDFLNHFGKHPHPMYHDGSSGRILLLEAAKSGNLQCLKWVEDRWGLLSHDELSVFAIMRGNLHMLKHLHGANRMRWSHISLAQALPKNRLDVIKWARENGCPWSTNMYRNIARFGTLDTVKWIFDNGCPVGQDVCDWAALNEHLDVLIWLVDDKKFQCSPTACANAASSGHIETLRWLVSRGVRPDEETWENAFDRDDWEMLEFLRECTGCCYY
jgi:hypothetical protein